MEGSSSSNPYREELRALTESVNVQQVIVDARRGVYEDETQRVNAILSGMDPATRITSLTPTAYSMQELASRLLCTNPYNLEVYQRACEAQRVAQRRLEEAQRSFNTAKNQLQQTNLLGSLANYLNYAQAAHTGLSDDLAAHQQDFNNQQSMLSPNERCIHHIPTHSLRLLVGSLTATQSARVENCIRAGKVCQHDSMVLSENAKWIRQLYRDLYQAIAKKILIAPEPQRENHLTRNCMHVYALALKLANLARLNANQVKWLAQNRIESVQELAELLDEQKGMLQQQIDQILTTNALNDANFNDYLLWICQ